ncbi:MAG: HypC/HybG/HupF family hydrogenase formation chaperone [Endomicrobiia bacterium]
MCLAVPMRVIEKKENFATVEYNGVKYSANLGLLDNVKLGDYVIVHAGFAIQKLDEKEAQKTLKLFQEIEKLQK